VILHLELLDNIHSQAIIILISLLRSGSSGVKMLAATVLGSLQGRGAKRESSTWWLHPSIACSSHVEVS
jgi:hypothetical protein